MMARYLRIQTTCPELEASGFALVAFDDDDIERARKAFDGAAEAMRAAALDVIELSVSATVWFFDDTCEVSEVRALIGSDALEDPVLLELRPAWLDRALQTEADALVVSSIGCFWTAFERKTGARIETAHLFPNMLAKLQGAA